jgi:hypothetical protein
MISSLIVPPFGAVLAMVNYRRLSDPRGMWRAGALYGLPAFGLTGFAIACRTPQQALLIWVARVILALAVLRDQRRLVSTHFAGGGARARVALACLAATPFILVFLAVWQILDPTHARPHDPAQTPSETAAASGHPA